MYECSGSTGIGYPNDGAAGFDGSPSWEFAIILCMQGRNEILWFC